MMAAIFAILLIALVLLRAGARVISVLCLSLCLGLSVWLFLWEIYSPEYGFRMPWIRTDIWPGIAFPISREG